MLSFIHLLRHPDTIVAHSHRTPQNIRSHNTYLCLCCQVRKLKRELDAAHEKIATLTAQLNTNVSHFTLNDVATSRTLVPKS